MKKYLIGVGLAISFSSFAMASESKLVCELSGISHGYSFHIVKDVGLSVISGGWSSEVHLKDSPIEVKQGKVSLQKSLLIEGEEPQIEIEEKEVVRISEASGKYVLLINRKSYHKEDGRSYFSGVLLKGALEIGSPDGEEVVFDELYCYGNENALDL